MTRPTDDELEAMAVRLDVDDPWCQPLCYEAAAMLRACKSDTHGERVKALLREAREDLASYVDADYPETSRAKYPDIQRRWHRDMELCRRIDAALRDMGVET